MYALMIEALCLARPIDDLDDHSRDVDATKDWFEGEGLTPAQRLRYGYGKSSFNEEL